MNILQRIAQLTKKYEIKIDYTFEDFNKESDVGHFFRDMEFLDAMNIEISSLLKNFSEENYLKFYLIFCKKMQVLIKEFPEAKKIQFIEVKTIINDLKNNQNDKNSDESDIFINDKKSGIFENELNLPPKDKTLGRTNFGKLKFENFNEENKEFVSFVENFSELEIKLEKIEDKIENLQKIFENKNKQIYEKIDNEKNAIIKIVQEYYSKIFEKMDKIEKKLNLLFLSRKKNE